MASESARRAAFERMSREQLIKIAMRTSCQASPGVEVNQPLEPPASDGKKHKRQQRPFDMSRYAQRHIALRIAYIGTAYQGFAYQSETPDTVEGRVLDALTKTRLIVDRASSGVSCGGRTDKGVSALGQVLALRVRSNQVSGIGVVPAQAAAKAASATKETADAEAGAAPANVASPSPIDELDYCNLLNRVLPSDIRVTAWTPTEPSFSARFSASHRTYKYFFVRGTYDVEAMKEGARRLLGEHDFRNFCKIDPSVSNFRRSVISASIQPACGLAGSSSFDAESPHAVWEFEVRGSAFLYHQVRCMVAVLFLIGDGKEVPSIVSELLDLSTFPRRPNYEMAADAPLLLYDIGYDSLSWQHSQAALAAVDALWAGQLRAHSIRGTMLATMLASLPFLSSAPSSIDEDDRQDEPPPSFR